MKSRGSGRSAPPATTVKEAGAADTKTVEKTEKARHQGGTWGPASSDTIRSVTADLRAGKITASQATERIIDDVVTRRVGGSLPSKVQGELKALLGELTTKDPFLAAKVQRLVKRKS